MVLIDDLVGYWKLDEASGDLIDAHGTNDMTNTGGDYGNVGIINDAITFVRANNDKAQTQSNTGILGSTSRSFNLWWFSASDNGSTQFLFSLGGFSSGAEYSLKLNAASGDSYGFVGFAADFNATNTVTYNQWNMVTVTYDGTTVKIYENGSLVSGGSSSKTLNTGAGTLTLARRQGNDTETFNAKVDEVGLFDADIGLAGHQELYASGAGLAYPFSADTTTITTALTLSTTEQEPNLITTIPAGALALTATLHGPSLGMPIISIQTVLTLTATLRAPVIKTGADIISGTVGTLAIATRYPVEEGLIAKTTKQTGNPDLVAQEEEVL